MSQKSAFLEGEGDQWFQRNPLNLTTLSTDIFNHRVANYVRESSRVLEIGCADGRRLYAIKQLARGLGTFTGVDPSREAIKNGAETFPSLRLQLGTSDDTGLNESFDLVLLGFCMYLCDRNLLIQSVAECDRMLDDNGILAILDFEAPFPARRRYSHLQGLWSYKMDYSRLFLASPAYSLLEVVRQQISEPEGHSSLDSRFDNLSLTILKKSLGAGYVDLA